VTEVITLSKCDKCGIFSSSSVCECAKVSQLEHRLEQMEIDTVFMKEDMNQKITALESRITTLSSLLLK
jgi:hypothetical protein